MEKIKVICEFNQSINFALQQNYVPMIRRIILTNLTDQILENIKLTISFDPLFASAYENMISIVNPKETVEVSPVKIVLSPDFLLSLTEKMTGNIHIVISHGDEVLFRQDDNIELLAYDEWTGLLLMPEIISAFVMPNINQIAEIVSKASKYLMDWTGSPSYTGYQTENPDVVKLQMASIYAALQESNIGYTMPIASYEVCGQRVRLPHVVMEQKAGTCLDLSILYASCLEAISLHPLIVFVKGHAFVGCWLEDETFTDCVVDDCSAITKRIADGMNIISLVECTNYVVGQSVSFDQAEMNASLHLKVINDFILAVDIVRCRASQLRPIPIRLSENGVFYADYGVRNEKEITQAPKELLKIVANQEENGPKEVSKQMLWERKLLDLSLRNTLLNFRVTKAAVQLMISDLAKVEDKLASGGEFRIVPKPLDWTNTLRDSNIYEIENNKDLINTIAEAEYQKKRVCTFLEESSLEIAMKNLARQAKISLEENGCNTLYLALGFLRWYQNDMSQKARYAPLVLIPVDVVKKFGTKSYCIRLRDEDAQMNITLLEMLRQDFELNIAGLDPLPLDENGVDILKVFHIMRQGIMAKKNWDIEALSFLGLFSFSQFIMWNDIRNRSEDLKNNKVVASLMDGVMNWKPIEDVIEGSRLDSVLKPADIAVPTSVDSFQLTAVCEAAKGQSFVLHGPPGTGKSQTITNMIANALYQGKTVLFVAEKMAALTVVQKRLAGIGLDPFCLELHSNKAQKRAVLGQLEKTLSVGKLKKPEDYAQTAERLHNLRKTLNDVVNAIHKKYNTGFHLYQNITNYERFIDYKDMIHFTNEMIGSMNENTYLSWKEEISNCIVAGRECGGLKESIFREYGKKEYSIAIRDGLSLDIDAILVRYDVLGNLTRHFASFLQITVVDVFAFYDALYQCFSNIDESTYIIPGIYGRNLPNEVKQRIDQLLNAAIEREMLMNQINQSFEPTIWNYDIMTANMTWRTSVSKWFLPKMLTQNKLVKELSVHTKQIGLITKTNIVSWYEKLLRAQELSRFINQTPIEMQSLFPNGLMDFGQNCQLLQQRYLTTMQLNGQLFHANLSSDSKSAIVRLLQEVLFAPSERRREFQFLLNEYKRVFGDCFQYESVFLNHYQVDNSQYRNSSWLAGFSMKLKLWKEHISELKDWTSLLTSIDKMKKKGLHNVVMAYWKGEVDEDNMLEAFEAGVNKAMAMRIIDAEPSLANFQGARFEETIRRYHEVVREFEELTIKELVSKLSEKIPDTTFGISGSSEIGILQKAIRSGGRMMSIRKLFDTIPTLLRRICPCMLMSPMSVAQYIDPCFPKFDLVIFDEASQLPTCEAVGAIARGENVVVVGDPKQLPPTSFFSANRIDEDNSEKEDLESVLDDCLAISMPQKHLLWHYRSRHESLIAYSNSKYYENKLYTFPSPNDITSEVKWIHVDGYYDKGGTKQNQAEGQAIIQEIVRRLKDETLRKESIGVVTFSSVQQHLIEDLLAEEFIKSPELEEMAGGMYEPILVKNLENVQGDERDVILFSIGYGPDKEGKVSMNFGPLNQEGGWRRLNVAISRARKSMLVFSTIRPEQIDLSRTTAEGLAGLKGFLEFAQRGKSALAVRSTDVAVRKQGLEQIIADELRELGYETRCNIGCSEYKIDIGVVNPINPDEYIMGIICDGYNYAMAHTARDRNILQPMVLRGLGWTVYHVWSLDWFDSPEKCLKKIKVAIDDAIKNYDSQGKTVDNEPVRTFDLEFEKLEQGDTVSPLRIYESAKITTQRQPEAFYNSAYHSREMEKLIMTILEQEAPIYKETLMKKVMGAYGIARVGNRVTTIFDTILDKMQLKKTATGSRYFCWKNNQNPIEYREFRVPEDNGEKRNIDEIPAEEISNAIDYLIRNQVSMEKTDLIRETGRLFGFVKVGNSMIEAVQYGLEVAKVRGLVKEEGTKVKLVD